MLPLSYQETLRSFQYDTNPNAWEFFVLDTRSDDFKVEKITQDSLKHSGQHGNTAGGPCSAAKHVAMPGSRILFARHRDHESREIDALEMPLDKDSLIRVFDHYNLPKIYFSLTQYGRAAGAYTSNVIRLECGKLRSLQIVVRVPHGPLNNLKSIWAVALSWELSTRASDCFYIGTGDSDISIFKESLQEWSNFRQHPLIIFVVLTGALLRNYTSTRQSYDVKVSKIETAAGLRKYKSLQEPFELPQERVRSMTREITTMEVDTTYMERRFDFAIKLCDFLLKCCHDLSMENIDIELRRVNAAVARELEIDQSHFSNQLHQIQCLKKRLGTVFNTLFSTVAQQQSETNIQIATEAKRDSSSMITIAVVTTLFLPATYVASLFGTNMFNFMIQKADAPVSKMFWLYWAITIPLTIAVFTTWLLWMRLRNRARKITAKV